MKKFFLILITFLILVNATPKLTTPQSCKIESAGQQQVVVYFYSDADCNQLLYPPFQYSIPSSNFAQDKCEQLSSNQICNDAWQAFSQQIQTQTAQPKSVNFAKVSGVYIANFYEEDNCEGNLLYSIPVDEKSIEKIQDPILGTVSLCEPGRCYPIGTACFTEAKKQLDEALTQKIEYCSQTSSSSIPPEFLSLSLLALMFNFTLLGLLYAIGELTTNSSIKAFVKNEYFEGVKSVILLVGITSILSTLNSLLFPLTGESNLINGACNSALKIKGDSTQGMEKILQSIFDYAFSLGVFAPFEFTFGIGVGLPEISLGFSTTAEFLPSSIIEWAYPETKFTLINYIVNNNIYGMETSFLIALARVLILTFTPTFVFSFLLPIGLFFRGFPVLRKIGGFFVALSIGLLIIYPSLVLFFDYPFLKNVIGIVQPRLTERGLINARDIFQPIEAVGSSFKFSFPLGNVISFILGILSFLGGFVLRLVLAPIEGVQNLFLSIISLYLPLEYFLSVAAVGMAQMVVVFIDLLIMYTLILDISDIIGGKFKIAGKEVRGFGFLRI